MLTKFGWIAGALCVLFVATGGLHAAIIINAGSNLQTFNAAPAATEWSTLSIGAGGTTYNNTADIDSAMLAVAAASVNGTLTTVTDYTQLSTARWNSVDQRIFTRPTGNGAALLMATLQNNTGSTVNALAVGYDLAINPTGNVTEQVVEGHRVYYSLTGGAGSWQLVGSYGFNGPTTSQAQAFNLNSLGWTSGSALYLLWADDNNDGGLDNAYIMDNVNFSATPVPEPASFALATVGLLGLVFAVKRRRRA